MTAALVLLFLGSAVVLAALWLRTSAYVRFFRYGRDRDQHYDFTTSDASIIEVQLGTDGFTWPELAGPCTTAFLDIPIRATWFGRIAEPWIEARTRHHCVRQYLERGARGRRLLNLSALLDGGVAPRQRVWLHGLRVTWDAPVATLILFNTMLPPRPRTLVLAPHPDDAEIAAFGFYSEAESTVVTVTAGDGGGFDTTHAGPGSEPLTGRLRVWDSIHVPAIGNVPQGRAINLGYADASLAEMHAEQRPPASALQTLQQFRSVNNSPLLIEDAEPRWSSLIRDLGRILEQINPELIVSPHPLLDDHPDHAFTTLALCEALRDSGLREGKLFLYTNHPPTTNLYPVGENDGVVSLPPRFGEPLDFRAIHSHPLSAPTQRLKFFALEAMHDLRTLPPLRPRRWRNWAHDTLAGLRNQITGIDARATSYFRRAVRGNELFFVCEFSDAGKLAERLRAELQQGRITWHTFQ